MKIRIFQEVEITDTGVGPVWRWTCPDCENLYGAALFWENAVKGANHHFWYHVNQVG